MRFILVVALLGSVALTASAQPATPRQAPTFQPGVPVRLGVIQSAAPEAQQPAQAARRSRPLTRARLTQIGRLHNRSFNAEAATSWRVTTDALANGPISTYTNGSAGVHFMASNGNLAQNFVFLPPSEQIVASFDGLDPTKMYLLSIEVDADYFSITTGMWPDVTVTNFSSSSGDPFLVVFQPASADTYIRMTDIRDHWRFYALELTELD